MATQDNDPTPLLSPMCDDPTCKGCNPTPQEIAECGLLPPTDVQSAAWEEPNPFADLDRSPVNATPWRNTMSTPQPIFGIDTKPYPRLHALVVLGTIIAVGDEYHGFTPCGLSVVLGNPGRESALERYLGEHPTPDTW